MNEYILDASALLALLNNETGSKIVEGKISSCCISTVNYSEVVAKLVEKNMPASLIQQSIQLLRIKLLAFDENIAFEAGKLRLETKKFGLAFGDRACLASAIVLRLPVITSDKVWIKISTKIGVQCICIR